MKPVIILSGQTLALGVVRALGTMGVPVILFHYDENAIAQVSRYVTCEVKVPHPERDESGFINSLLAWSDQLAGALLFPVTDETLAPVSRNKDLLQRHYRGGLYRLGYNPLIYRQKTHLCACRGSWDSGSQDICPQVRG